jgi:hypothetical protein
VAARRPRPLARPVERHRPAGDDEPDQVPQPHRRRAAAGRQPRPVGRVRAAAHPAAHPPRPRPGWRIRSCWPATSTRPGSASCAPISTSRSLAPVAVEFTATSVSSDFPIAFDGPLKRSTRRSTRTCATSTVAPRLPAVRGRAAILAYGRPHGRDDRGAASAGDHERVLHRRGRYVLTRAGPDRGGRPSCRPLGPSEPSGHREP